MVHEQFINHGYILLREALIKDVMLCYLQYWSWVVHVPHVRHLIQVVNLNITTRNHYKFQGAINELTFIMETKIIVFKLFQDGQYFYFALRTP